jgi:hypothetical protein
MKKKIFGMLTILFFVVLTTAALAQITAPSDEGTRPGPGMMYSQSQGQGQGTYGPGMMYGYGAGWMGGYGGMWLPILVVLLIGGLVAWGVKQRRHGNRT